MSPETSLPELRMRLALAQNHLRAAKDALAYEKAITESDVIMGAGGDKALGGNAEARERALLIAVAGFPPYQERFLVVQALQDQVTILEAEIEAAKDVRREREWAIRERQVAVLEGDVSEADDEDEFAAAADALGDDAIDDLIEVQSEIGRSENLDGQDVDPNAE